MDPLVFVMLGLSALFIGALIGSVGVGGVLLAPALLFIAGFDLHLAIATSLWSFFFTGLVGTVAFARRGTLDWRSGALLSLGILPAALLGALVNGALSQAALKLILALVLVGSGLHALLGSRGDRRWIRLRSAPGLLAIGVIVGFGSALTGTGGPVLLVPALLFLGVPPLTTVGVSQLTQIPIAASGTVGYLLTGDVDLALGVWLGLASATGVVGGARLAHTAPPATLRRGVALALVLAGVALALGPVGGKARATAGHPTYVSREPATTPAHAARSVSGGSVVATRRSPRVPSRPSRGRARNR